MSELKTLKDLEYVKLGGERNWLGKLSSHNDLRAEAIKWVKGLIEYEQEHYKVPRGERRELDGLMMEVDWEESSQQEGIIKFIMHFFNLTEEDLK